MAFYSTRLEYLGCLMVGQYGGIMKKDGNPCFVPLEDYARVRENIVKYFVSEKKWFNYHPYISFTDLQGLSNTKEELKDWIFITLKRCFSSNSRDIRSLTTEDITDRNFLRAKRVLDALQAELQDKDLVNDVIRTYKKVLGEIIQSTEEGTKKIKMLTAMMAVNEATKDKGTTEKTGDNNSMGGIH